MNRRLAMLLCVAGALGVVAIVGLPPRSWESQFDLRDATISLGAILSGGPGKDGIPALVAPRVVEAAAATHLRPDDRVLAVTLGGAARAYPLRWLTWHELVNDEVGGVPVLISYCPLCGSGAAFDRRVDGATLEFGVSGLLFESNVLMYDRADDGLWSQLRMAAVTGPRAGTRLTPLPLELTTWKRWRTRHPATTVLSAETGHRRDYGSDPYLDYADVPTLMFPVTHHDARRVPKEWVVGVALDGLAKAYPFRELARAGAVVEDRLGAQALRILYDAKTRTASVQLGDGRAVPVVYAFWFAWAAFHPETAVFEAAGTEARAPMPERTSLLPLVPGRWWIYEERTPAGERSAVERWQVRAADGGAVTLRTRQARYDGRADVQARVMREERLEVRIGGIVRRPDNPGEAEVYLLRDPIERGRTWEDAGGRCRVETIDDVTRAVGREFAGCTTVACVQGGTLRIVSSYAPGVGMVRQDIWYGGIGPFDPGGDLAVAPGIASRPPAASLVLAAWGTRH